MNSVKGDKLINGVLWKGCSVGFDKNMCEGNAWGTKGLRMKS